MKHTHLSGFSMSVLQLLGQNHMVENMAHKTVCLSSGQTEYSIYSFSRLMICWFFVLVPPEGITTNFTHIPNQLSNWVHYTSVLAELSQLVSDKKVQKTAITKLCIVWVISPWFLHEKFHTCINLFLSFIYWSNTSKL